MQFFDRNVRLRVVVLGLWLWVHMSLLVPHSNDHLLWKGPRQEWFRRREQVSNGKPPASNAVGLLRMQNGVKRSRPLAACRGVHGLFDTRIRRVEGPGWFRRLVRSRKVERLLDEFCVETVRELPCGEAPENPPGFQLGSRN